MSTAELYSIMSTIDSEVAHSLHLGEPIANIVNLVEELMDYFNLIPCEKEQVRYMLNWNLC